MIDLNINLLCNIRSNFDELEMFINRVNIKNPICLIECWLNETSPLSDIHIPNYNMLFRRGNHKVHRHCDLIIMYTNS